MTVASDSTATPDSAKAASLVSIYAARPDAASHHVLLVLAITMQANA